jgi:aspartyl-tRNA(Asn)/glutamyl-tRNA(Gln) amidotransferase subunit B
MSSPTINSVQLVVGLEIHVELATRSKMFSRAPNPAHPRFDDAEPNTLIDPTILALPGALPVMNRLAVEMSMMVGLALKCQIATHTKWDRKSYFYPDLPKSYQISQYDLPLCFDGVVDLPAVDDRGFPDFLSEGGGSRIGIIRAHLEEDAGKLLHEAPGGASIAGSIADYNRAGTPLLEIVTQPDFRNADDVVLFAKTLRNICRFLGVSEGVMQKGHMRFEPNINCHLTLSDGSLVKTPIVEIKNLNSFKSLKGAIEYELADQPRRWQRDGKVMGPGAKTTRGWDDAKGSTFVQREKEDAHDYRYFPDPDLPPVYVSDEWRESVRSRIPDLPLQRFRRYCEAYALGVKESTALVEERDTCFYYEAATDDLVELGIERSRAGKVAANLLLNQAAKRANERGVMMHEVGLTSRELAALGKLREDGKLNNQTVESLFDELCTESKPASEGPAATLARAEAAAKEKGWLIVRDDAAMAGWIAQVLAANPKVAEDVKGGKVQAVGRLVGDVMKLAGGKADAKTVREEVLKALGVNA